MDRGGNAHFLECRRAVVSIVRTGHPYPIPPLEVGRCFCPNLLDCSRGFAAAKPWCIVDAEAVGHAFPIDWVEAYGMNANEDSISGKGGDWVIGDVGIGARF